MTKRDLVQRTFGLAAALVVSASATGCVASSAYMKPLESPPALRAPDDRALVVFVRPSAMASGIAFTIIDDEGRFMGDSTAKSSFAVKLSPGRHLFISWAENSAALEATVEAGKTYFVEVAPRMGGLSARAHLLAIKPGAKSWENRKAWLGEVRYFKPDSKAGEAYLASRGAATVDRVKRGRATFAEYDAEERASRVLRPEDGI